jgi:hypothetical protein
MLKSPKYANILRDSSTEIPEQNFPKIVDNPERKTPKNASTFENTSAISKSQKLTGLIFKLVRT